MLLKVLFILVSTLMPAAVVAAATPEKTDEAAPLTIAGWVENVWLSDNGTRLSVRAKLDTGAKSSSINAPQYDEYAKNGKTWIRFNLTNARGKSIEINTPLIRVARIRRAGVTVKERPVIALQLCVAGHTKRAEFTLADRSDLNYQVLIGREFLDNTILVDSGSSFTASGKCKKER